MGGAVDKMLEVESLNLGTMSISMGHRLLFLICHFSEIFLLHTLGPSIGMA